MTVQIEHLTINMAAPYDTADSAIGGVGRFRTQANFDHLSNAYKGVVGTMSADTTAKAHVRTPCRTPLQAEQKNARSKALDVA